MENKKANFNELSAQEAQELNGGSYPYRPIGPTPDDYKKWFKFWEGVGGKVYDAIH